MNSTVMNRTMHCCYTRATLTASRGFTLIEVMVAVFVLAVGILGLAGMQAVGLKESQNSYFRTQADMLANDMVDRMRANPDAARDISNVYVSDGSAVSVASAGACQMALADCDFSDMASYDIAQWQSLITNSSLPSGKGTLTREAGTNVYTIQVFWDENRDGVNSETCSTASNSDSCIRLIVQI